MVKGLTDLTMDCEDDEHGIGTHKITDKQIQNKTYQLLSNFSEEFYINWKLLPTKTTIPRNVFCDVSFKNTEVYKNSKTDAYFNDITEQKLFSLKPNETMEVFTKL